MPATIALSLRARGIGFRAVDIEPLSERAVVRDIIMLTRALLHFGDKTAWLALLRSPWVGIELADLWLLARAHALIWQALQDDAVLAQLSEPGRLRCRRVRETLLGRIQGAQRHLTHALDRKCTWLCLGGPSCAGGEEDLELARAAFYRLSVLEERGMPDVSELTDSFAELFADSGSSSGCRANHDHPPRQRIGIRFRGVAGTQPQPSPPNRGRLLLAHQFARTGRGGMVMAARPAVGAERDRLFDFLRTQQDAAGKLEAQRLLYVACTRAKSRLWLTASFEAATATASAPLKPRARKFAGSRCGPQCAPSVPAAATTGPGVTPEPNAGAPRGGPLMASAAEILAALWPRLPATAEPQLTSEVRDETPVFDWAGETARRVGSLVHAELQSLDLSRADRSRVQARDADFRQWLAAHGVPADRLAQAAARVTEALLAVQGDARARWILASGYRDDWREHALSGVLDDQVHRIVLDRSFIDAGVRWIIDYKTSQHQGSGVEQFLDREVERYRAQLHRYGRLVQKLGPEPVRLGLYFPLMRAWREIEFN